MADPWYVVFQPALSAGVGFAGVIATLLWNAYLQRQAHQLERKRERDAVLSAVLGELNTIKQALEQHIEDMDKKPGPEGAHFYAAVGVFQGEIFKGVLSRIGFLPPDVVQTITAAFGMCQRHFELLPVVTGGEVRGTLIVCPNTGREAFKALSQGTLRHVNEAIEELER